MNIQLDHGWIRRGFSLLWDANALSKVINPSDVVSIREFFTLAKAWPEELPGSDGNALVVAGIEGCLDSLTDEDGKEWLETDLKRVILSFQEEYEGQAALILWLPSGRRRVSMVRSTEEYFWKNNSSKGERGIPLGRCLWAGSESDVARILLSDEPSPDIDSDAYVGLYHPRIS
jgi:hypothetical protein